MARLVVSMNLMTALTPLFAPVMIRVFTCDGPKSHMVGVLCRQCPRSCTFSCMLGLGSLSQPLVTALYSRFPSVEIQSRYRPEEKERCASRKSSEEATILIPLNCKRGAKYIIPEARKTQWELMGMQTRISHIICFATIWPQLS